MFEPFSLQRYHFANLVSTQDRAREFAQKGQLLPFVVSADEQRGGRGRGEHGWVSMPGNVHATFVVKAGDLLPESDSCWLPLLAGAALHAVLSGFSAEGLFLKWPNDVETKQGEKLAGLLCESFTVHGNGREEQSVLIGMGVNVAAAPRVEGRQTACLRAFAPKPLPGCETLLDQIFRRLLHDAAQVKKEGIAYLQKYWEAHFSLLGRQVMFHDFSSGEVMQAQVSGLTQEGALRLLCADGALMVKHGGEIRHIRSVV